MKVSLTILLFFHKCFSFELPQDGCRSDLKINNDHYNITDTYHIGDAYATDAHYDVFGNLFYVKSGRNANCFYFDIYMVNYKSNTPQKILGLPEGLSYSVAIDKNECIVYFGTEKGIYKYNYESHNVTLVSESTLKIDMLFVDKDGNKYITENDDGIEMLYLLDEEKKIRFSTLEALNEMAIDDKNNIYFIKEEQLYVLKSTLSKPTCIGNITYDGVAQISFHKETVFIASDNLAYYHENDTGNLNLVDDVPGNLTAIAFDQMGNFVLGLPGKILKYKKNECYFRRN